jgi:large subunit ribosomal protein L9
MEVILMQKVANLGNIGDKVKVKPGYGRNFLLPSGKAALATAANLKKFEERRAEFEKLAADSLTSAQTRAKQLEGTSRSTCRPRPARKASCSAPSAPPTSPKR